MWRRILLWNCSQWFKDTNLKANHNYQGVSWRLSSNCSQWFKDTNLKANHNRQTYWMRGILIVPNGSKILIWKQITTFGNFSAKCCEIVPNGSKILIWKQITTLLQSVFGGVWIVPNGSKILIWKQITTFCGKRLSFKNCSQWFKDTNLKANHNYAYWVYKVSWIVPNGSKILIWKQITTLLADFFLISIVSNGSKLLI